jgi:glycine/D-amino acid oxidase-like deaminating enzyme
VEHRSVWLATGDRPSYPRLERDLDVDLVVVGGGITGLTTALLARRDGASVALLEARTVGAGTTGGTTGKVSSQHSVIYDSLVSRHGQEKAQQYADANQAGMQQVARLTEELGIDCDLTWASSYAYTTQPGQRHQIVDEYQAAHKLGLPASLAYETELPVHVEAAVVFSDQVHLHAGRYVAGLARGLTEAGGSIYEGTRVTDIDETGDGVEVEAGDVTVRARHVVVATLLPIRYAGGYFAKARPTRSYGLAVRIRGEAPEGMGISID